MSLFLLLFCVLSATSVSAQTLHKEYIIKQVGTEIGTTTIDLITMEAETLLNTVVNYPQLGLEIHTSYVFSGTDFPKEPASYSFKIVSGGVLDFDMTWDETVQYSIAQFGTTTDLGQISVLPLDNNVISDYMVASWIYDVSNPEMLVSNMVIPVLTAQGQGALPMTVSYSGEEIIGQTVTEHFQVNLGLIVDLWVDQQDRSLVKLEIPMQGFEIVAVDLELEPEQVRAFKDFGGHDFVEMDFQVDVEQAVISGSLTIPEQETVMPGVILVAGSGPTDRDGNSFIMPGPADYLKEIAHYLASQGIVVLRFDKRGVGDSPGTISSFNDFINDISVLVDKLQELPMVSAGKVFVVGHSEGAWLASEVVAKRDDLSGLVLLSGSGYKFFDTMKRQLVAQTDAAIAAGMFDSGLTQRTVDAFAQAYEAVVNNAAFNISDYNLPTEIEQVILSVVYQKDILQEWILADPARVLAEVGVPVLIVQGTADTQITVADAEALAAALPEEQREVYIFDGVDHVLKMTYGQPLSYTDPDRRVEPGILQVVGEWLLEH